MKYTKITIPTTEESIDILTSHLSDLGAEGFEIGGGSELHQLIDSTDPDLIDQEVNELRNEPITVTVYIPDNEQGRGVVHEIDGFLHAEGLEYVNDEVKEEDWENNWKAYFKPLTVGKRLVIKPTWEQYDNPDNRLVLEIDPSGAFGTGQHATTMLCMELLEKQVKGGERIIDVGCGSGILSAAAMLFGAETVTAIDICETATRVTCDTLKLNNITNCSVYCGNVITDETLRKKISTGFDVAVANITADVIIAMTALLPDFTKSKLILSGIISPRLNEVLDTIQSGFNVVETRESEGWCALVCVKKQG